MDFPSPQMFSLSFSMGKSTPSISSVVQRPCISYLTPNAPLLQTSTTPRQALLVVCFGASGWVHVAAAAASDVHYVQNFHVAPITRRDCARPTDCD